MKKAVKAALITAAVLIAAGVGLMCLSLLQIGFDLNALNSMKFETVTHWVTEPFTDLNIQVTESNIRLVPSSDGQCRVECRDSEQLVHTVAVKDGALTVTRTDTRRWYQRIGIYWGDMTVTVYLPERVYGALLLKSVSGDVTVPAGFAFSEAALQSTSGNVAFAGTVQGRLWAQTTSGDLVLGGVTGGAVELRSTSGDVQADEITAAAFSAQTTSGDLKLSALSVTGQAALEAVSGDVQLNSADAGSFRIKAVSGDVQGQLLSPKRFVTHTVSGTVRVPADDPAAGICEITTTSGDIRISLQAP